MKKIISLIVCLMVVFSSFSLIGCSDKLPETLSEWKQSRGVRVDDGVISAKKKDGYLFSSGNQRADNVLEFSAKLKSDGTVGAYFFSSGKNNGYNVAYSSTDKALSLYRNERGDKTQIAVKSCELSLNEWHPFRIETKDTTVKIFVGDNGIDASPWAKFEISTDNTLKEFGVMAGKDSVEIKDVELKENNGSVVVPESTYVNPVDHTANPFVLQHNGVYYMYAAADRGIDVHSSYDLVGWNNRGNILAPNTKGNALFSNPSVAYDGNKFYICYSANKHLVLASSDNPDGPFTQTSAVFMNDAKEEGDPEIFFDGGKLYVMFVREQNGVKKIIGAEVDIAAHTYKTSTEKVVLEGAYSPYITKIDSKYYLLYSTAQDNAAIAYAVSDSIMGNYSFVKNIIMTVGASKGVSNPSFALSPDGKEQFIIYQSNDANGVYLDRARFNTNTSAYKDIEVFGPTGQKQPVPGGVVRIMYTGDKNADGQTKRNDLIYAMNMAAQNMTGTLDYDNNYLSIWEMPLTPNENYAHIANNWHGHNIGRWLDSMYEWQNITGNKIDPFLKNAVLNNCKWFFSNPDSLCFQPTNLEGIGPFPLDLHSLREGMMALLAIIKYEEGEWKDWAIETAEKGIVTIEKALTPQMTWDKSKFWYSTVTPHTLGMDQVQTSGRYAEALMMYYEITQSTAALALAKRIIDYHFDYSTNADGTINYTSQANHTHSYFNTIQAIFLYGKIMNESKYIERAVKMFDVTFLRLVSESGVVTHDLESGGFGWECSSVADAMQLGMWLVEEGYTKNADFVERMIRARILPDQLTDVSNIKFTPSSASAGWNLAERALGGFSMVFDSPYSGKHNTTDVTGHIFSALCDVYNHQVRFDGADTYVMYHFNFDNDKINVKSVRNDYALLTVTVKEATDLKVRIPKWATEVTVKVNGATKTLVKDDIYAVIGAVSKDDVVEISFNLPTKQTSETQINQKTYQIYWKGDEIVKITPNSAFNPFFPDN